MGSEPDAAPTAYRADYCPRCGTATSTKRVDGRARCWCPECDVVHWRAAVPVVGVAVVDDGRVLAFYHPRTGLFDLPSGHQELSDQQADSGHQERSEHRDRPERPAATAARELEEETNLAVDPADLELFDATVKRHPLGRYNFSVTYVVDAAATSGTVDPETDADVVEWMTPATARERRDEFVPGVVEVIERAVDAVEDTAMDRR
jgi:8-oxo-dGTP pyrophosphatase MutT (NUDIX family)